MNSLVSMFASRYVFKPSVSDEIEPSQASGDSVEAFPSVTANRYDENIVELCE